MQQTLKKKEILRGYNAYQKVLTRSNVSRGRRLRIFVLHASDQEQMKYPPQVGFGVSRVRSAVVRNRLKRLMREVVRKNKEFFYLCCKQAAVSRIILMCSSSSYRMTGRSGPSYQELEEEFRILMQQLRKR